MKRVSFVLLCVLLVADSCFAAPLTEFSPGNFTLDYVIFPSGDVAMVPGGLPSGGGQEGAEGGIMFGLGGNFAMQLRSARLDRNRLAENNDFQAGYSAANELMFERQEFKLLYALNKELYIFSGVSKSKAEYRMVDAGEGQGTKAAGDSPYKYGWQLGVMGVKPLNDRWTGWASVAGGAQFSEWEVGLAYAATKSVDVNVNYRSLRAEKMTVPRVRLAGYTGAGKEYDIEASGLGVGVTIRF